MELAIPILALGGLYVISNQSNKDPVPKEAFTTGNRNHIYHNLIPKIIQWLITPIC